MGTVIALLPMLLVAGKLPRAIAGQSAGISHGALIVVGGSSFEKSPWDGGVKKWSREIYVYPNAASLENGFRHFELDEPLAYGCGVVWEESLIVAGGSNGMTNSPRVRQFSWEGMELKERALPALPVPVANCGAARIGDRMYVVGGQETPASGFASKRVFDLNLRNPKGWEEIESLPGKGRILPVVSSAGDELFVFSGAELTPERKYLRDGWRYEQGRGWRPLPSLDDAVVAASSVSYSGRIYVFSGDDGRNATRIAELRGKHPGFSKSVLAFDVKTRRWQAVGELPFSLVTTTACVWRDRVLLPGGEDRPGHRSDQILQWRFEP